MIRRLHHTALSTPDLDRLVGFYCSLFGFEVVHESSWPRGYQPADEVLALADSSARVRFLASGDSRLEIFEFANPTPRPQDPNRPLHDHGLTHLSFQVDDLRSEVSRLGEGGMRFLSEPRFAGGLGYVYGRDPDGNLIELVEVLDDSHPFATQA